jgi:hypothetical protein
MNHRKSLDQILGMTGRRALLCMALLCMLNAAGRCRHDFHQAHQEHYL